MIPGMEAIVLAGGLGSRLKSAVPDLPKCMAPVAGRPFLEYIIHALRGEGVGKFIFSLGYKSDLVLQFLEQTYPSDLYEVCIEKEPLGTGGAALLAAKKIQKSTFLIVNGDTLFETDLNAMSQQHRMTEADLTIALKEMHHADRYGTVRVSPDQRILGFEEKRFIKQGCINGGIYLVEKKWLTRLALPEKCSFERDVLEAQVEKGRIFGFQSNGYFIDIGIPDDFEKAGRDLHGFL